MNQDRIVNVRGVNTPFLQMFIYRRKTPIGMRTSGRLCMANVSHGAIPKSGDRVLYTLSGLIVMEHDKAENGGCPAAPAQARQESGGNASSCP